MVLILTNSVEPDEMPHVVAFHPGIHCLPKYPFRGFQYATVQSLVPLTHLNGKKKPTSTKCHFNHWKPGSVVQSVTCLATDACLTADPGVASSIRSRYHTCVEIDHEKFLRSFLPSAISFKKGFCQLQAKVCKQRTG